MKLVFLLPGPEPAFVVEVFCGELIRLVSDESGTPPLFCADGLLLTAPIWGGWPMCLWMIYLRWLTF